MSSFKAFKRQCVLGRGLGGGGGGNGQSPIKSVFVEKQAKIRPKLMNLFPSGMAFCPGQKHPRKLQKQSGGTASWGRFSLVASRAGQGVLRALSVVAGGWPGQNGRAPERPRRLAGRAAKALSSRFFFARPSFRRKLFLPRFKTAVCIQTSDLISIFKCFIGAVLGVFLCVSWCLKRQFSTWGQMHDIFFLLPQ